ncbi:unnamed protein product [Peniophora sp. CBMAI 1063]|nr:unnamed protein product [Peniophora sp. CBMAI 1063]
MEPVTFIQEHVLAINALHATQGALSCSNSATSCMMALSIGRQCEENGNEDNGEISHKTDCRTGCPQTEYALSSRRALLLRPP